MKKNGRIGLGVCVLILGYVVYVILKFIQVLRKDASPLGN